jgi:hypothetical protein
VERVSREVTQLLEQGVPVTSHVPAYHYTKLDELKIDMLAKASENARIRAENIVGSGGGGKLGKLWNADMGGYQHQSSQLFGDLLGGQQR